MNSKKGIIIGITGGIAAYKTCELIRLFIKDNFAVFPVMTPSAARFITPLTIAHLACHRVYIDPFDENVDWNVEHVELVQKADAMIIAPATANIIAKIACGLADDFVSLTALTFAGDTYKPLVIAPAMNYRMYRNPATINNLGILKDRGIKIIEPEKGELACGEWGEGRLAPVDIIHRGVIELLGMKRDFEGRNVIITAGGTMEPIDPVRFIGNRSSGKMGYALATEFKKRGANVTLISSSSLPNPGVDRFIEVTTSDDLKNALEKTFPSCDILVMAAAVSDFKLNNPSGEKIRRGEDEIHLDLKPTEDIIAGLAEQKGKRIIIGFAAESHDAILNARSKMKSKNLDMIVANDISRPDIGFASDFNEVIIIREGVEKIVGKALKTDIAREIVDSISEILKEGK